MRPHAPKPGRKEPQVKNETEGRDRLMGFRQYFLKLDEQLEYESGGGFDQDVAMLKLEQHMGGITCHRDLLAYKPHPLVKGSLTDDAWGRLISWIMFRRVRCPAHKELQCPACPESVSFLRFRREEQRKKTATQRRQILHLQRLEIERASLQKDREIADLRNVMSKYREKKLLTSLKRKEEGEASGAPRRSKIRVTPPAPSRDVAPCVPRRKSPAATSTKRRDRPSPTPSASCLLYTSPSPRD